MGFGVPYVFLFLPIAWALLLRVFPPEIKVGDDVRTSLVEQYRGLGPLSRAQKRAIAASLAFMLPVSTPPNALVYGTGYVRIRDMVRGGFMLDILGCVFTVLVLLLIGSRLLGLLHF